MKHYRVSRNGEVKLVVLMEKHSDGTLWTAKSGPLIDSMAPGFVTIGKEKIANIIKEKKYSEIPVDCFAREGTSPSGLEVISNDDIRDAAIAVMTPAQIERNRISQMFAQARSLANSDDENNVAGPMIIEGKARAALAQWKKDYPAEVKEEKRATMLTEADHQEDLASGALVYDMDGSLSQVDQQARHDAFMAKAKKIREDAANL